MNEMFSLREREIFQALHELSNCTFVIIGGYAVNAYTLPRFSVDCDIVIKDKAELATVEKILLGMGYVKEELPPKFRYSDDFCRYEKRLDTNFLVSFDILINAVTDRLTGVHFTADWVFENSGKRRLLGKTTTTELDIRIVNITALIVMKIIACRATDIRDVFMMLPSAQDKDWIKSEVSSRVEFKEKMNKIIQKISSKQFKDGLSGVYGYIDQKVFDKHVKAVRSLLD